MLLLSSLQIGCFVDSSGDTETGPVTSEASSDGETEAETDSGIGETEAEADSRTGTGETEAGTDSGTGTGETEAETDSGTGGESFNVPAPHGFSGLAYDGSLLWYTAGEKSVTSIDPETGVTGTSVAVPGYVHAIQGGDFWTHCGCGGSPDAVRLSMINGESVDIVNTGEELANEIVIRGIAYDGVDNVLYLAGAPGGTSDVRLLRVESDAEPDVLLGVAELDSAAVSGLTWDGEGLWAILGTNPQTIARIDGSDGQVIATLSVPDAAIMWSGIAAVGPQLFLLGLGAEQGVLASITP